MKGPLNPAAQLKVLSRVWGTQVGHVFLPWIDGKARTTEERRRGYHEGYAFAWPKDREKIEQHLNTHTDDDLYFTPAVFEGKKRIEQQVAPERCLWADLDEANPQTFDQNYRPTIAWESSPGRYQGIWILDKPKVGASWAGNENHRLTMHLGADKSGWDSTQLLRVPGRLNHKPDHVEENHGKPAQGQLLWDGGPRYQWSQFEDLPEVGVADHEIELVDDELLLSINRHDVWARVKLRVSKTVREFMAAHDTAGNDRSDVLWQIERELADAGCSIAEIVAIVRPSIWNKYSGRADELKRLKIEAAKAVAERKDLLEEYEEVDRPEGPTWATDWFREITPRPKWLVQDIWTEGACGFIAGAPKSYKSWTALDMAISVATGLPFLGQFKVRQPGPVLYLQEEDALALVKDRYRLVLEGKDELWHPQGVLTLDPYVAHANDTRPPEKRLSGRPAVYYVPPAGAPLIDMQVQSGFIASDPGWQSWLEDRVAKYQFRMVIIDTLSTTAGGVDTDRMNDLMNSILKPLKVIAQKHNTAMCVVHHNRKGDGNNRAGQEMLGSVGLHAWVDCALYARSKEGSEVMIDRESKSGMDLRFMMTVPQMFEDYKGTDAVRVLWSPSISERGEDVGIPQEQTTPKAERSTAGRALAAKLKMFGPIAMTEDEIEAAIGKSALSQLTSALANGYVERTDDGRFRVA